MTKKAAKKPMDGKEMLVVASKVKSYIRSRGLMASSQAIAALNARIYSLLNEGIERTRANRRSTVKPQDL